MNSTISTSNFVIDRILVSNTYPQSKIVKMSETTIGIEYLPLKAGVDLEAGEAKSMWEAALDTISKQQGVKSLFWGRQIEHPDILQLAIGRILLSLFSCYTQR